MLRFTFYENTMSENNLWAIDTWVVSNTASEAREEDLGRVGESMAKAGQMRTQIKQMQQQNATDAFLLMLLFKYVQDEELIHFVFSRVVKEGVSVKVIFAHFLPLLYQSINIERLTDVFPQEIALINQIELNVVGYVSYIKGLQMHYPEIKELNKDKYVEFIRQVLAVYKLIDREGMEEEKRGEFLAVLGREI